MDYFALSDFHGALKEYALVILVGLPSVTQPVLEVMEASGKEGIPLLFILNNQSDLDLISRYNFGVRMSRKLNQDELIQGYQNPKFSLFSSPDGFSEQLINWPPLRGPLLQFEQFDPSGAVISQLVKGIRLQEPLIQITRAQGVRYGFIFGEGLWQWRIYDYLQNDDHFYFNTLFTQLIQFLLQDEIDDRLTVYFPDQIIQGNPFEVNAMLYNTLMETINHPDMRLLIRDSSGQDLDYLMGRSYGGYQLTLSSFKAGRYTFEATADPGDGTLTRKGVFEVRGRDFETLNSTADYGLMQRLALVNGGEAFVWNEWDSVRQFVSRLNPREASSRQVLKWYEPVDIWWFLAIIVGLLSLEWFLRRWYGIR